MFSSRSFRYTRKFSTLSVTHLVKRTWCGRRWSEYKSSSISPYSLFSAPSSRDPKKNEQTQIHLNSHPHTAPIPKHHLSTSKLKSTSNHANHIRPHHPRLRGHSIGSLSKRTLQARLILRFQLRRRPALLVKRPERRTYPSFTYLLRFPYSINDLESWILVFSNLITTSLSQSLPTSVKHNAPRFTSESSTAGLHRRD